MGVLFSNLCNLRGLSRKFSVFMKVAVAWLGDFGLDGFLGSAILIDGMEDIIKLFDLE